MTDEQLKAYREALPGATDEQLEALSRFVESLADAWRAICDAMASFASAIAPAVKAVKDLAQYLTYQSELERCPNRKVVHLAKHAKKARTRKKNLHRAMRIIEKEAKG